MSRFFVGREVKLLLENRENPGLKIWHMKLEESEFGHMSCIVDEEIHFIYVIAGNMVCQINQDRIQAWAGDGIFVNGGNALRFLESAKEGCEFYLFKTDPCYIGDGAIAEKYVTPVLAAKGYPFWKFDGGSREFGIAAQKLKEAGQRAQSEGVCAELYLKSLICQVWAEVYQSYQQAPPLGRSALREKDKLLKMLKFFAEHYQEKITLAEMAANSEVSSGEYCRFFKKMMNQTPFEYLQVCRIEKSLPDVLEKNGALSAIALRHGFNGASYYAETFKKEMGCAPGDYRKWYCLQKGSCPLKPGQKEEARTIHRPARRRQESMPAHLL